MTAMFSYSTFTCRLDSSMKQLYHAIRFASRNGSSFKGAIIWDDAGRMRWHFKVDLDGDLLITDMAAPKTRPVRHRYGAYQFRICKAVKYDINKYPGVRA